MMPLPALKELVGHIKRLFFKDKVVKVEPVEDEKPVPPPPQPQLSSRRIDPKIESTQSNIQN